MREARKDHGKMPAAYFPSSCSYGANVERAKKCHKKH